MAFCFALWLFGTRYGDLALSTRYEDIDTPADLIRAYRRGAKKQFGQHFLSDPSILDKICSYAQIQPQDRVLEIGPGCGTLTWSMLTRGADVLAAEIDRDAIAFLKGVFADQSFALLEGDALKVNWLDVLDAHDGQWKCVANLPYNVGTALFLNLTQYAERFESLTLMFQREVAKRMAASVSEKAYGSLSLLVELYYDAEIVMSLPPGAFSPPPKVHSAVVKFRPVPGTRIEDERVRQLFERVIRAAFQQRRKKLTNGLKALSLDKALVESILTNMGRSTNTRAEELSFDAFHELVGRLAEET